MNKKGIKLYYKIIGPKFYFRDICPGNIDVLHIPYGTEISSPFNLPNNPYRLSNDNVNLDKAYIHFANGAFNTMLWYNWLFQSRHVQNNQIYKIEPLDEFIIQDICPDQAKLPQYGSNSIKFLEKQNINDMYDMAVSEFYDNKSKIMSTYSHIKLQPIIKAWQKHIKSEINTR